MAPVRAPLPTPRYLPFQLAASGIQSSMPMLESDVGVSVATTRQNGNGADTVISAVPLLAVVWYGSVIVVASVSVPSWSVKPVSDSQVIPLVAGGDGGVRADRTRVGSCVP